MTALNAAAHDLGRARWMSGRKLRSSLPRSNSLVENTEVIESLTPIYLTRQGTEPGGQYSLTLEGLLASEGSPNGALVIEAVLRCVRELFGRDPDFRFYTLQDLTPHFAHPVEFEFVDSIIQIAELVNGGGGSPGKPDYRWGTPLDIEALSRLESIQDFTDYRRAPRQSKTLGTTAAHLLSTLHERRKKVFSVRDAASITRLQPDSARSFMSQLVQRGIASRLKPGLFVIVPQELADGSQFLGNPYVVGRELADAGDYFISHASAMDLHRMVTQPPLVVDVTTTRSIRS